MNATEIHDFLDGMVEKELLTAEEAGEIDPTKVEQFFSSKIGQRLCQADRVYREVPFNLLKDRDGEEIIIQGIIDCYFEEGNHFVLLDYKSNYVTDDPARLDLLAEHYRPQLELYREALETIRGVKVDETFLYLFSVGKELRIENRPSR
jgi:ATP-dependent helicase/nuclease subunit A